LPTIAAGALALLLYAAPGGGQSLLRNGSPETPSPWTLRPFSRFAVESHTGLAGAGFNVATPLSRSFNLRTGADFFGYTTAFNDQGAHINARLQLRSGHGSVDWFPFRGRFRVSPLIVFANNNQGRADAVIPAGSTITLGGQDFVSDPADPLHGGGSITFRKLAPGISTGIGNLIPRGSAHFSLPLEAGFYYVGQPALKVAFTGSACVPSLPQDIGCAPVDNDPYFQQSLNAFLARNQHNLSYASFFPVFSLGVGYAF
jgi:hypothetical protein